MICPNCSIQMHQYKLVGGGTAKDDFYQTWELKKCPNCGRMVRELYQVELVSQKKANEIEKKQDTEIVPIDSE